MRVHQRLKLKREESILLSLKMLDYLSRSQIQKLHNLGGDRNARRVLNNMSEYISCFRDAENIYYLNKEGRERVGADTVRHKINQVSHYLMRNDLYIHLGPQEWRNEVRVGVKDVVTVVPDAYFKYNQMLHFLEVDHTQKMFKNKEKIDRYKALKETGVYQEKFKHFP